MENKQKKKLSQAMLFIILLGIPGPVQNVAEVFLAARDGYGGLRGSIPAVFFD